MNGYTGLIIEKIQSDKEEITSFTTLREAKSALFRITESYCLCQKINRLYKSSSSCCQYQLKECNGACLAKEPIASYNGRVAGFLSKITFEKFTRLFEASGRTENEKGLVYIENGVYKGFGFCSKETANERRLPYIKSYQDNKDVRRILIRHLITI